MPPLPDWLFTRITASYVRPTSFGSIGRYGTAQSISVDGLAGSSSVGGQRLEALLDGVLVRTGEGGVDEVAGIRVPKMHGQLRAVLDRAPDLVDLREIDLRVDALTEQVQAERDEVDVAGALAVPE